MGVGLTAESTKKKALADLFQIEVGEKQHLLALAGNPNTGKSTVFNYLTGLKQHTGNWPGKTVVNARGKFKYRDEEYILVDVPGTYSLFAQSEDETVARDFLCFGNPETTIVVCDATCLERNFNLVFQVMEISEKTILVINLMDEAKKKNITVDRRGLEAELGIPVVLASAKTGMGMEELKETIHRVVKNEYPFRKKKIDYGEEIEGKIASLSERIGCKFNKGNSRWWALRLMDSDERFFASMRKYLSAEEYELIETAKTENKKERERLREQINEICFREAEEVKRRFVREGKGKFARDRKIDDIVTSRIFGIPLMLLLLTGVLFITVKGANYPSELLSELFFWIEGNLTKFFDRMNAPDWLHGVLVLGLFRTLAWIVSVMLPPMAIFFPLFTLLEDLGYLPRVAYNMDHLFKKACAHGKQCLSMCMGLGCNAAGVVGTRIIESPRERMIAVLTNNFVPCNGRFPTLIAISTIFFASVFSGKFSGIIPAMIVSALVVFGILMTLLASCFLSKTLLKGLPSAFTLELPPYRKPKIGRVIYTSIIDRTVFVLGRAVAAAIPAGIIIWIFGNLEIGGETLLRLFARILDPVAYFLGLDGIILLAFILALPANEIFLPIALMAYLSQGSMAEYGSLESLREILVANGWTYLTALNVLLFSLFHWPCLTTLLTMKKETGSMKWTFAGFLIPTITGISLCMLTAFLFRLIF